MDIPDHVLTAAMAYLDAESVARVSATSRHFQSAASNEWLWRRLTKWASRMQRTRDAYQSAKREARVCRSWRLAFPRVPRVRHTGIYALRSAYYKQPYRDLWHTPPPVIQVEYHRAIHFFLDGTFDYVLAAGPIRRAKQQLQVAARDVRGRVGLSSDGATRSDWSGDEEEPVAAAAAAAGAGGAEEGEEEREEEPQQQEQEGADPSSRFVSEQVWRGQYYMDGNHVVLQASNKRVGRMRWRLAVEWYGDRSCAALRVVQALIGPLAAAGRAPDEFAEVLNMQDEVLIFRGLAAFK